MEFSFLHKESPTECAEYECASYAAFIRVPKHQLTRLIYDYDEASQRLATRVPYAEQLVYVRRDTNGDITAGISINIAMCRLQAAGFGFQRPTQTFRTAEILIFFSNDPLQLRRMNALWHAVAVDLHARGIRVLLATSAVRPLRAYLRAGCDILAETLIAGEKRYFLALAVTEKGLGRTTSTTERMEVL
jgi:hypothetical protein